MTTSTIRKSHRSRTLSEKAAETTVVPHIQDDLDDSFRKRRKLSQSDIIEEPTDKIDPVEKLLSLTNMNNDFLVELESSSSEEEQEDEDEEQHNEIASVNFTKILQDNIRNYYSRKLRMNQYKDSFALLNSQSESTTNNSIAEPISPINNTNNSVPFFKNVNFGSSKEYTIDDYFSYDEDESTESSSPIASTTSTPTTSTPTLYIPKINPRFNYRQTFSSSEYNGISSSPMTASPSHSQDIVNILNKRCILTGKASEVVSTGNFLINDFFL
ncbi:hypothetical protein JA1_004918 [Spathaspora sp. JA1]|nr:hypothetical protein JA1_004918 [Spathaspora sp. JA1]